MARLDEYHQSLVDFLLSRNASLKEESLQLLSQYDRVHIGDIIFEVCILKKGDQRFDIVAYKLSAERGYSEGGSTVTLPDGYFYTEALRQNMPEFNGAFGINFQDEDGTFKFRPLKIWYIHRKDTERYFHNSIKIKGDKLSRGKFLRLITSEEDCTYDLVARVVCYAPH